MLYFFQLSYSFSSITWDSNPHYRPTCIPRTLRIHTHFSKLLHVMILRLKALFEYHGQLYVASCVFVVLENNHKPHSRCLHNPRILAHRLCLLRRRWWRWWRGMGVVAHWVGLCRRLCSGRRWFLRQCTRRLWLRRFHLRSRSHCLLLILRHRFLRRWSLPMADREQH